MSRHPQRHVTAFVGLAPLWRGERDKTGDFPCAF